MNERIKALLEQATEVHDEWRTGQTHHVVNHKIFAELIIKETLQAARAGIEFGNGMEDAVYRYFGVEE